MFGFTLVLPLIIIIITGNLLRSRGFYNDSDIKALTKTLYWVILPPLLFRTTFMSGREILTQPNLMIALNVCYILTIAIAWILAASLFHRGNVKRTAFSAFASIRANNIYLGFPVMYIAMGDSGISNASIYLAVSTISFQFLSIIAGEIAMLGKLSLSSFVNILKKIMLNPMVLSCCGGIAVALTGLDSLPQVFDETLKLMGGAATAVALLALGGTLELSRVSRVIQMLRQTWADCAIKLLIHPALMWLMLLIFPVTTPLLQATVMLSSMPSAVNCFILAKEMDMDGDYAADLVASSTVLGAISIPLWGMLLGIV